jgi:ribosome-binding factor A
MGKEDRKRRQSRERGGNDGLGTRAIRLQELIRQEVNLMFETEIRDRRLEDVTITFVELTPDGSCARLWFSAAGRHDKIEALTRATGFLRTRLAESLGLKKTPELRFRRDDATGTLDPAAAKSMEET